MRPTLELLGELAEQTRSLVQVELSLLRAEIARAGGFDFLKPDESRGGLSFFRSGSLSSSSRSVWRFDVRDSGRPRVSYCCAGTLLVTCLNSQALPYLQRQRYGGTTVARRR